MHVIVKMSAAKIVWQEHNNMNTDSFGSCLKSNEV